jgi:hypothetical protein
MDIAVAGEGQRRPSGRNRTSVPRPIRRTIFQLELDQATPPPRSAAAISVIGAQAGPDHSNDAPEGR